MSTVSDRVRAFSRLFRNVHSPGEMMVRPMGLVGFHGVNVKAASWLHKHGYVLVRPYSYFSHFVDMGHIDERHERNCGERQARVHKASEKRRAERACSSR